MEKYGNTNSIDKSSYLIISFSKNCTFPCTLRIGFSFIKSYAQNARARAMRALNAVSTSDLSSSTPRTYI